MRTFRPSLPTLWVALTIIAMGLAGCNTNQHATDPDDHPPGVTDTEVVLGSSLPRTGHASYLGRQICVGSQAYIKHINEQGGVHGRQIRIITYDDSYDPPKCLANTQKLIIEDQVFSLFCYVGTPTTVKIIPLVKDARIPLVGMFTGANALRVPFNKYIVNIRASYYQETEAAVQHMVKDLGLTKIGVFYQYDAYGFDGLTGTELALKKFDLAPVARGSYIRGTMDVEEGLDHIASSGAEAVVMIGTYDPCAKFIRLASARNFNPIFYTVSFVGAEEFARHFSPKSRERIIMSQVVPPVAGPATKRLLGDATEFTELMARYFPDSKPDFVALEGYINAKVLVEALEKAGPDLTREKFIAAIESLQGFHLGGDTVINFSPSDHQGMERVYFTRLVNGTFELFDTWPELLDYPPGEQP
ncbi:ABC transporter substrate-binding protein [Desulfoplanes sp.]